jgi:hypothetical protein
MAEDVTADLLLQYGVSAPPASAEESFAHLVAHIPAAVLDTLSEDTKLMPLLRHDPALLAEPEPIAVEDYDLAMRQGQSLTLLSRVEEARARAEERKKKGARKKRKEEGTTSDGTRKKKKKE